MQMHICLCVTIIILQVKHVFYMKLNISSLHLREMGLSKVCVTCLIRGKKLKGVAQRFLFSEVSILANSNNLFLMQPLNYCSCTVLETGIIKHFEIELKLKIGIVYFFVHLCYSLSIKPVRPIIGMTV